MRSAVIDASILVKLVVQEPGTDEAVALLDREDHWVSPNWVRLEVASALWEKVKRSQLLETHAERSLAAMTDAVDELVDAEPLVDDAFQLSVRLRHPVYDCVYLAAAVARGCKVITADKRFARAAERAGLAEAVELLTWEEA